MLRLLRVEGKKTIQNVILWVVFGIMLAISFLYSKATFVKFLEILNSYSMQYAGEAITRGEYVFLRTMGDASFTAWMAVIAGALLIGFDFQNRTINTLIFAGNRRASILIVKLLYFYLSAIVLSALYPITACLIYSTKWLSGLTQDDARYVWRCVACRALIDMAMMSFSLIIVFIFKDIIRSLIASLIVTVTLALFINALSGNGFIAEYFPARVIRVVMQRNVGADTTKNAMIYSAVMVAVTCVSCYLLFRKADLK